MADDVILKQDKLFAEFEECEYHYFNADHPESVVDYIFLLDGLNFCFWPSKFDYSDLAELLKAHVQKDPRCLEPQNLMKFKGDYGLWKKEFLGGKELPLGTERHRIVMELAAVVIAKFGG